MSFRETDYRLDTLVSQIENGDIALPDIQRPFIWKKVKVRDLFDSMYKGYPVGYFLFWENRNDVNHTYRNIDANHGEIIPRLLIIDGQQRLTSLYAVLKGKEVVNKDYQRERILIAFNPKEEKFEVSNAAIRRNPEWITDISELWLYTRGLIDFANDFLSNLEKHREISKDGRHQINNAIQKLYNIQNYSFHTLELSYDMPEEQVSDIFVRINSKGISLNQSNFILTLMSVFWDDGRAQLENFCRKSKRPPEDNLPSPYNRFIKPSPDQILKVSVAFGFKRARLSNVYSLLRGKDLETQEFSDESRERQFSILKEAQHKVLDLNNWHNFFTSLIRAGYRDGSLISSENTILYNYALYLIGKYDFKIKPLILRDAVAKWFFMSSLTRRYTNSPESQMELDLSLLKRARDAEEFISIMDNQINTVFTNDYWEITLPNELLSSSANSPVMFAYYASLNLLRAKALYSNLMISDLLDSTVNPNRSALEKHHLFPKAYLRNLGKDDKYINQIANFALVEWNDNLEISDSSPSEYVPKLEERFSEEELNEMYFWHALPEKWENMNYDDFLEKRRKLMANVIREGFKKIAHDE